ncbi:MAG: TIM barrel protein [Bacteroidetes bacterium]|nr:TIM barrel protein [Bacteroidota bacterium]
MLEKSLFLLPLIFLAFGCSNSNEKPEENPGTKEIIRESTQGEEEFQPEFSLTQWSFHRELFAGEMDNFDFINTASEMGFDGVEYVSQFFQDKVDNIEFLDSLNRTADKAGIDNVLIMVDNAGNLGASDPAERKAAVEAHKKWVTAAKYLACNSIRVNAHGDGDAEQMRNNCLDALTELANWGQKEGVNILVENHGQYSSNGAWLASLVDALEDKGVGTLPDFNNWCWQREGGHPFNGECLKEYDRYQGLEELLPYAGAISVKSLEFDEEGNEANMDYSLLIELVRESGYEDYYGIEYDGKDLPSREGIEKTRELVLRVW